MARPLRVVHVAAEASPYAKTGGLGDVVAALPPALARAGVDVTVVIPGHRAAHRAATLRPVGRVSARVSAHVAEAAIAAIEGAPVPTFAVDAPAFDRPALYGDGGHDYPDNAERFVFFCRAALEWLRQQPSPPDVVHVHDWPAALVPVFLVADRDARYPELRGTHTITTIHNLAYQGRFWEADWHLLNLNRRFFSPELLEFYGYINFLKGGIVAADTITTVSPRYAEEIRTPAFGEGLDGVLRARTADVVGILNGVDYGTWSPFTDRLIPAAYDAADLTGKARCRAGLQAELGLDVSDELPLAAVISRLAGQKGIDLVAEVADELLATSAAQLVVLGSGDPSLERALVGLAERNPRRVAVRLGFDDPLAHRIEAGADLFLMPSRYEPCGLSQLYSLRYGTVPVVHATGGLVDTVEDYNFAADRGTGFVFRAFGRGPFLDAIRRALALRQDPARWQGLQRRAMACDFSWDVAAGRYRALYDAVLARPVRLL